MSTQDLSLDSLQNNAISNFPAIRENQENLPQTRGFDGKFVPGVSGNPSGRPKSRIISEELKELLAKESEHDQRTGAQKLGEKVFALAEQDKDGYLALAAIKEITDRVEGKAVQRSDVRGLICMMPAEAVMTGLDEWAGEDE